MSFSEADEDKRLLVLDAEQGWAVVEQVKHLDTHQKHKNLRLSVSVSVSASVAVVRVEAQLGVSAILFSMGRYRYTTQ